VSLLVWELKSDTPNTDGFSGLGARKQGSNTVWLVWGVKCIRAEHMSPGART
jgi:hypothetical protein